MLVKLLEIIFDGITRLKIGHAQELEKAKQKGSVTFFYTKLLLVIEYAAYFPLICDGSKKKRRK